MNERRRYDLTKHIDRAGHLNDISSIPNSEDFIPSVVCTRPQRDPKVRRII